MGAWGHGPLDNDNAADWMGDLFEDTAFRDAVMAGVASGDPDTVRAAAVLVSRLAEVWVWPIETLDADRVATAAALLRVQDDEDWMGLWDDPDDVAAAIDAEVAALALSPEELEQARAQAEASGGEAGPRRVTREQAPPRKRARKVVAKKKTTAKKVAKKKATKKTTAKQKTTAKKVAKKKATKKPTAKQKTTTKKVAKKAGWLADLSYQDGKSDKFWRIRLEGESHTVHYGRAGTDGQRKTKSFPSAAAARTAAEKLIEQKRSKGYR